MKSSILFSLFAILLNNLANAQTPTTVYTCKNGAVGAVIYSDISQAQKNAIRTDFINQYGPVYGFTASDIIADPTPTYNCHSYAWHLREGNLNKVWINNTNGSQSGGCYINNNNINTYWTNGCMVQVCNEADADKIHYYCGDHSAVKSASVSGKYDSKWGQLPALRHNPTSVPYAQPSSVRYYSVVRITGSSSILCSGTRVFSTKNIPGATYSWTFSSTLSAVGSTSSNQLTVQRNGSSTGQGWVKVQVSTSCSATPTQSLQFNFDVGMLPDWTKLGVVGEGPTICPNVPIMFGARYNGTCAGLITASITNITWSVSPTPSQINYDAGTAGCSGPANNSGVTIQFPSSPTQYNVRISATNACGTSSLSNAYAVQLAPSGCPGGMMMAISPNPATSFIDVELTEDVHAAKNAKSNRIQFSLYDLTTTTLVKSWSLERGRARYKLNISGVKKGTYVLHALTEIEEISQRVIVE